MVGLAGLFGLSIVAAPHLASAQTCSATESICGKGTCCPSSAVCCPSALGGCCEVQTPYCCGSGICAVSASACPGAGDAAARCEAYDVPCGPGCAAAGSDCCDDVGHYCTPGLVCATSTLCSDGLRAATVATPPSANGPSPLTDPPDAVGRSCAIARQPAPAGFAMVAAMILVVVAARRSTRPRRLE